MNRISNEKLKAAVVSALASVGAVFLCLLLFSWFRTSFDLPESSLRAMSGAAICAGCFFGAFFAANIRRKRGFVIGIMFGAAFFLVLMILGGIFVRAFSSDGILSKAALIFCFAVSGGIFGVNTKKIL